MGDAVDCVTEGTPRRFPDGGKHHNIGIQFEPRRDASMVDLTRTLLTGTVFAIGILGVARAEVAPVTAEKPASGPALAMPSDSAGAEEKIVAPERPVPLLDGLLGKVSPSAPEKAVAAPNTITGTSIKSSVPSAVTSSPKTGEAIQRRPRNPLDQLIDQAIETTSRRTLVIGTHTPWQIGHGMLAYRHDYMLRDGSRLVNAYEWVRRTPVYTSHTPNPKTGADTRKLPWFYLTEYGARPQDYTGRPYEFEGHPNQFLAFFAMARLPVDYEFTVQGQTVTFGQMLENAKMEINDREEVAWDLWVFSYYFDVDDHWTNAAGERWSMARVVSTTMKQFSHTRSPCGGCHALFALASARNAYLQTSGQRLSGVWLRAHMLVQEHIALAKNMQNANGSFSSNYFKGPGDYRTEETDTLDPGKRISVTGHTLEFLMVALPQSRLDEAWVQDAIKRVASDLVEFQNEPIAVGGMYHAIDALVLYRERTRPAFLAGVPSKKSTQTTARLPRQQNALK